MYEKVRIVDLQDSNIEDLINICSSGRFDDPTHLQGVMLKKQWLIEMLEKYGFCAKIAYYNDKPVAQILYYPETADVTKVFRRENVLVINCIYNPRAEAQKLGIGAKLLHSVINDAKQRKMCLGNRPCRFILAKAFNSGEFLPMPEFYKKNGFLPTQEGNLLHLPVEGVYESKPPLGGYEPLIQDKDKAVILYGPICQFSYQFAKRIEEIIHEVAPSIKISMINEWEEPEESKKRKNWWLIVNAKPIQTFFMETEKFKEEIKQAVG